LKPPRSSKTANISLLFPIIAFPSPPFQTTIRVMPDETNITHGGITNRGQITLGARVRFCLLIRFAKCWSAL
jgi:hypothetical protein